MLYVIDIIMIITDDPMTRFNILYTKKISCFVTDYHHHYYYYEICKLNTMMMLMLIGIQFLLNVVVQQALNEHFFFLGR